MSLNHRMAEAHERDVCERLGARKTRGSGNQPANPMDGRQNRFAQAVAFAIDCKATRGESISVTRKMVTKAEEQAHGERPMLALRWYDSDRLSVWRDYACIDVDDLAELLEGMGRLRALEGAIQSLNEGILIEKLFPDEMLYDGELHAVISGLVKIAEGR
jgi:hypothetical protein